MAVATFASLPFSRILMKETKPAMSRWVDDDVKDAEERTALNVGELSLDGEVYKEDMSRQLRRWRRLNLFRSTLALVGGLVAASTVIYRG